MKHLVPTSSPAAEYPQQVLILAPTGQDAALITKTLEKEKLESEIYRTIEELTNRLKKDAGAILIAEEALSISGISLLNRVLDAQEPWSDIPIIVMTSGGNTTLASLQIIKEFTPSGNITLLERPFRPITLISSLQVALRARRRQYQVRDLLEFQIQATRIRDEFISIASHELKTPLTSLKLQTQINQRLLKRGDPAALSEYRVSKLVETTGTSVDRLSRLVEDMLDVSRIHSGKMHIQKSEFDLSGLVQNVVDHFMPQLAEVGSEARLSLQPEVIGCWDRFRIEQVVNNLLTNAIRYSPAQPIEITVSKTAERACLVVQDHGIGIAKENQERIFQRFERAVLSENISGLGLGLYICREIVLSHGGTIGVQSELGAGARFTVELPLSGSAP
jgi:signal transduction histidine kinase